MLKRHPMGRSFWSILTLSFLILISANIASAEDSPSVGAKDMPGAIGTFVFKPMDWISGTTTWWKDTDGVSPGVAGCHIGTDSAGKSNGRMFGEACLADGFLVESNPGTGVVHKHANDEGHPDRFDCNVWCIAMHKTKGMCVASPAPPCEQSAKCVCN